MRIIKVNPRYESLRPWLEQLPDIFEQQGEHVYGGKRNWIKLFVTPAGLRLNVKRYHAPRFLNLLVYSFGLRKPKCERAWEYPAILRDKGFETPEPVAIIEERWYRWLGLSYLITIQCDYEHDMYMFGNADKETYTPFAIAFGKYTARLHDAGILHRDYSPGNILWKQDNHGVFHFLLVDINRMKFGNISIEEGCTNFARLWGQPGFFEAIADSYAKERRIDRQLCRKMVMEARNTFWHKFARRHQIEYELKFDHQ